MDTPNYIDVTDGDGWHKEFPLAVGFVYVGSAPGNGVLLEPARGGGVAEHHLQLLLPANSPQQYQVVNLDTGEVLLNGGQKIAYLANSPIADGDTLRLGDFRLVFHLGSGGAFAWAGPAPALRTSPATAVAERTSTCIGLSLALDDVVLCVDRRLEGAAILQNLGGKQGVQFRMELEGLPQGSYSIGPAPILFPNGEGKVKVSLAHPRAPSPAAGPCRILVRATAPEAYPGEAACAAQVIEIEPYYSHALRVR